MSPGEGVPLKVMILDHQGKSQAIASALSASGCLLVRDPANADAILIDHDLPAHGKLRHAETCVASGGRAFIYPHGAGAGLLASWDGLAPVSPLISGVLAPGPGHAEVAHRFGYPHPVYDVGWTFCPTKPRRATGQVETVLFAAQHPKGDGHLSDWKLARNRDIFDRLLDTPARLTVRYIHDLEANGIPRVDGVEYVQGRFEDLDEQLAAIDAADVVVSDRATFSNVAIARGTTTVMFDSTVIAKDLDRDHTASHLDDYREYIRFPFEAEDGVDIWELMKAAAADEDLVGEWRARFVGGPLDVHALLAALRGFEAPRRRSARLHAAALAAMERGQTDTAATLLGAAITQSLDLELLNDLAVVWWNEGRYDDARMLLRTCLALDPGYRSASDNLSAITKAAA
ncbi:MAG TPA: hypothetical protein VGM80_11240 [Gaiellaceae bacterium]|jgi:hypothetical protein